MRPHGTDGIAYLVTLWTFDARPLFADTATAALFCRVLGSLRQRLGFRLHAYVILPDRVRFIVGGESDPGSIEVVVRRLKLRFAREANERAGRLGLVWQDADQRVTLAGPDDVARRAEFLHRSPEWARLARHPAEWRWSSYRAWAGEGRPPLAVDLPRRPESGGTVLKRG